ncbi:hypothetical protein IU500_26980 [Nocardia terpenica]|uniref:Uncharacterized protein n=1 Tax=Nocardia terpenica TaxID=455432 RepID=A0A164I305_9NOCA|nr:hypothetical protein [Nocardia terpenica]KZM69053.1 hypothetical protein AWN90_15045 [Nocardia terpenica]MBF6061547.1 hypothetical protein [Nocardia terpenica]MBF6107658.1 hypothetical protein [Nocardia terpenica]MBF6109967.1 hypothetical protein [Nocardia terpenica]MBF6122521.1 hypothetical protein [Nocardia terpenica]
MNGNGESGDTWGPIRPGHAVDGWRLMDAPGEFWLEKTVGTARAVVRADTVTTCFWCARTDSTVGPRSGHLTVDEAMAAAEKWLQAHTDS